MLSQNRVLLEMEPPPEMPYKGSHRVPVRRPAAFTAFAGAATAALVATSAGAAATMLPASATSQSSLPKTEPAANTTPDLPHSASQVMEVRAVYHASAVRAARAEASRLAAERAAARAAAERAAAARRAAAQRAAQLAAQKRAQQLAAQKAQQAKAAQAAQQAAAPTGTPQQIAQGMLASYGWGQDQWSCLDQLWQQESGWSVTAANPSGAYGIPQALPGSKMASAGSDWQTDATTQIKWGLGYIQSVYGTPCSAWSHEESAGWY
jgi:hypothetical protein